MLEQDLPQLERVARARGSRRPPVEAAWHPASGRRAAPPRGPQSGPPGRASRGPRRPAADPRRRRSARRARPRRPAATPRDKLPRTRICASRDPHRRSPAAPAPALPPGSPSACTAIAFAVAQLERTCVSVLSRPSAITLHRPLERRVVGPRDSYPGDPDQRVAEVEDVPLVRALHSERARPGPPPRPSGRAPPARRSSTPISCRSMTRSPRARVDRQCLLAVVQRLLDPVAGPGDRAKVVVGADRHQRQVVAQRQLEPARHQRVPLLGSAPPVPGPSHG